MKKTLFAILALTISASALAQAKNQYQQNQVQPYRYQQNPYGYLKPQQPLRLQDIRIKDEEQFRQSLKQLGQTQIGGALARILNEGNGNQTNKRQ